MTACSTDLNETYPTIKLEVAAGNVTSSSVTFTITATGADEIYYWVDKVPAATEAEAAVNVDAQLMIEKGTYLDAQIDLEFNQEVTASGLAASTAYNVYVYAKNFAHNSFATPTAMTTAAPVAVVVPTVAVAADEEEVYPDSFLMWVTTTNTQKASWLVVPKYTEGVNAAKVLETGTAMAASDLNTEAAVVVEGLEPATEYDFYVAVENDGVQVLSDVVAVTTTEESLPVIEAYFGESALMGTTDLYAAANIPGIWVTLTDVDNGFSAQLVLYDLSTYPDYPGYLSGGDYPALAGSIDGSQLPQASCLLADPGYTSITDMTTGTTYSVVGDLGTDADGNVYGVSILTVMPDSDNNMLTFNLPVVDAEGNEAVFVGQYTGPLGYSVTPTTVPMNLDTWSFTTFEMTTEGNVVTLTSTSVSGSFQIVLQTENGKWATTEDEQAIAFIAGEGGNMTGGYTSYVEGAPEFFEFVSGRISFTKVDDAGNYILNINRSRGQMEVPGWIMIGDSCAYEIDPVEEGYKITVTAK